MENTRQPIPLRIRQYLRDAVGRMHPSVSFVSCIGVLLAYLTGVYITGSLHEASRWMGAMLACTSLVVVLQSHSYKESLPDGPGCWGLSSGRLLPTYTSRTGPFRS